MTAFSKAIALNPGSARSYMGRGWAYLTMNDQAHANADFSAALKLDPSLRPTLEKEVAGVALCVRAHPAPTRYITTSSIVTAYSIPLMSLRNS